MERISENINSIDRVEELLRADCDARLRRRGKRGRPRGSGRKHAEGAKPKSFRHFSPLAHSLLAALVLGNQLKLSEEDIVEEALVRMARAQSNENPRLAGMLKRAGR